MPARGEGPGLRLPALADATDLDRWAVTRDAQAYLPALVRRLVSATAGRVEELAFRSGEGVHLSGWDGVVRAVDGNAHVPEGVSGWELGVRADVKGKADEDYESRRADALGFDPDQTTFVFVTARRWGGKDAWVGDRRGEGHFRDVRAYDADDLEAWLERAPAVHVWISRRLGKRPFGVVGLEERWEGWSGGTDPPTSPDFVISGREIQEQALSSWIAQGQGGVFSLKAESPEQASAFLGATAMRLPEDEREACFSRCLVVEDLEAWRVLEASETPLLLVPDFDAGDAVNVARSKGHGVFVPVWSGRRDPKNATELPRPRREAARAALLEMGVDEAEADGLAGLARRSPMALRRRLAPAGGSSVPEWARPENAADLLPALLAGAWEEGNEEDREVVSRLGGTVYEEVSEVLTRWVGGADPPARLVGGAWVLASKDDAWTQLEGQLRSDVLGRFEEVVPEVLGEDDPAYELPAGNRWAAALYDVGSLTHSARLREGLADTLALLAARAGSRTLAGASTGQELADRVVRKLLGEAGDDWRLWASLGSLLPLLAEASPRELLAAVEAALAGDEPVLTGMFTDAEGNPFEFSPHTHLLWALEATALAREHVTRASLALARLAVLDPGGRTVNRPVNSLREIFSVFRPRTAASPDERMQVVDLIRERAPEAGWQLLVGLLPTVSNLSFGSFSPRHRDWGRLPEEAPTYADIYAAIDEVLRRLLEDAGEAGPRWAELVGALEHLPTPEQRDAVADGLLNLDAGNVSEPSALRDELRRVITRHRTYGSAAWALPAEEVDRLQRAYDDLEPPDPVDRHAWLFAGHPQLSRPIESSWEARQEELSQRRTAAVEEVSNELGTAGLEDLAARAENPAAVGLSVGLSGLLADGDEEEAFLTRTLVADEEHVRELGIGFAVGRRQKEGWDWADARISGAGGTWSPEQRARFLSRLPIEDRLYRILDGADEETRSAYWALANPLRLSDANDCAKVTKEFLDRNEPYSAVEVLALWADQSDPAVPAPLVARALEEAATTPPPENTNLSMFGHHAVELLEPLYDAEDVDDEIMARIEWVLLPLLDQQDKAPRIFHEELGRRPGLFAEVVAAVYPPDAEEEPAPPEAEASEAEQAVSLHARELLDGWRTVPGTADDGTIDAGKLDAWVSEARVTATARNRAQAADRQIGRVLAFSPAGADGAWPHEAVRAVIEKAQSDDVDAGFRSQAINGRGIHVRGLLEGGGQERELATRYRAHAEACRFRWPRVAILLDDVADSYEWWARRHDHEAELREDEP